MRYYQHARELSQVILTRCLTGAIHVYLGPFFTVHRSEWNPETLIEGTYDIEKNMRLFEESNARWAIS